METTRIARGTCALFGWLAVGCGGTTDVEVAAAPAGAPIVNGTRQPEVVTLSARQILAVGAVMTDAGDGSFTNICTGTLVAPSVVLTAAHCVRSDSGRTTAAASLAFATGENAANPRELLPVARVRVHNGYDPYAGSAEADVAVLELADASTAAEPLPVNCAALDRNTFVGQRVQDVGYGDTASTGSSNTRRLWAVEEVVALGRFDFTVDGHGERGVCFGDSGGPALWMMGGRATVVGTLSWGDADCGNQDHLARTDYHCPFIRPFLDAAPPAPVEAPAASCSLEGVLFEGAVLQRALAFVQTMTCAECNAVLDPRTCEDAINDAASCQQGDTCTGCADEDTRADGVGCAELAGYAYFGAASAAALRDHVATTADAPAATAATVEGVTFTASEAAAALQLANTATLAELDVEVGLDSRAAQGIVDARPLATVEALAAVPYVGAAALEALKQYPHP